VADQDYVSSGKDLWLSSGRVWSNYVE